MKKVTSPMKGSRAPSPTTLRPGSPHPVARPKPQGPSKGPPANLPSQEGAKKRAALLDCSNAQSHRVEAKGSRGTDNKDSARSKPPVSPHVPSATCVRVIPTTETRFLLVVQDKVWAAERDGSITVRNLQSADVEVTITLQGTFCWCLVLCEGYVWAGYSGGQIRIYNAETYELCKELLQHAGGIYCLTYAAGHVYSGSNDFECFRWHCARTEFIRQYSGHRNSVRCVQTAGPTLITGSDDHTIRLWDILTGEVKRELGGHHGGVLALLCVGPRLWTAADDGCIRVWHLENGELLASLNDHAGRVPCLRLLGRTVASVGVDKTMCCYDAETFRRTGKHQEHGGYINHLTPISQSLRFHAWTCSNDKTIRVWTFEGPLQNSCGDVQDSPDNARSYYAELDLQCQNLQEQLRAAAEASAVALRDRDASLTELRESLARAQAAAEAKAGELQNSEARRQEAEAAAEEARRECARYKKMLNESEAALQHHKSERATTEATHRAECARLEEANRSQAQRQQEERLEHREEIQRLREELAREREAARQAREALALRASAEAELQSRLQSLTEGAEEKAKSYAKLQSANARLKAELDQAQADLQNVRGSEALARQETTALARRCVDLAEEAAAARAKGSQAEAAAGTAVQRFHEGQLAVQSLEEKLQMQEAMLQEATHHTGVLEDRLKELEVERMEMVKKESEFEFVIQSRSELVRQVWELYCEIGDARKLHRELMLCPLMKQPTAVKEQQRADAVLRGISAANDRNKRIICNYFTEIEKFHVGISPYNFPPDEDSGRYRVMDSNLESLRRLGMHDLRRTAVLTTVREKAVAAAGRRSNSVPSSGPLEGSECDPAEARRLRAKARRATSPGRCHSPAPKPPLREKARQ